MTKPSKIRHPYARYVAEECIKVPGFDDYQFNAYGEFWDSAQTIVPWEYPDNWKRSSGGGAVVYLIGRGGRREVNVQRIVMTHFKQPPIPRQPPPRSEPVRESPIVFQEPDVSNPPLPSDLPRNKPPSTPSVERWVPLVHPEVRMDVYEISTTGVICNAASGRKLEPIFPSEADRSPHLRTRLVTPNDDEFASRSSVLLHRIAYLMLVTFKGDEQKPGYGIGYVNGKATDIDISNLYWKLNGTGNCRRHKVKTIEPPIPTTKENPMPAITDSDLAEALRQLAELRAENERLKATQTVTGTLPIGTAHVMIGGRVAYIKPTGLQLPGVDYGLDELNELAKAVAQAKDYVAFMESWGRR